MNKEKTPRISLIRFWGRQSNLALNLKLNKRGVNHIEVILTFVIFIAAISFALWFFNPIGGSRFVDLSLDYGFREVLQNTSVELEIFSVKLNEANINSGGAGNVIAINISEINPEMKTKVTTLTGAVLNSNRNPDDIVNVESLSGWSGVDFLTIEFSEEFEEDSISSTPEVNESYYKITSSKSKSVVSEKKFKELKDYYLIDYDLLREDFNLNVGFGFSLVFENETESIHAQRQVPEGLEVFLDKKRVEVLKENEELKFADLVIKVW